MNSMNKIFLFFLFLLILNGQQYVADFARIDFGAKALASGNVFFVNQGDLSAVRFFPADYSFNKSKRFMGSYISKFDGLLEQAHAGYSHPLFDGYNISLNWNFSGVTNIPKYERLILGDDLTPTQKTPSGFFDNTNHVVSVTFSRLIHTKINLGWDYFKLPVEIPIAINTNYLKTDLYTASANGFTLDLSFGFKFNLGVLMKKKGLGDITFFTNIQNIIGGNLQWSEIVRRNGAKQSTVEPISKQTHFGVQFAQSSLKYKMDLLLGFQYETLYSTSHYGFSFIYDKTYELRFGIDEKDAAFGLGVNFFSVSIFASMKPKHDLGKSLNMDLMYEF